MLWNLLASSYKKMLVKCVKYVEYLLNMLNIPNMSFIHFMSLKLLKTAQKCLIFWNFLGVSINKVLIKNSKFILHSFFSLEVFRNHPEMFAIFEFIK